MKACMKRIVALVVTLLILVAGPSALAAEEGRCPNGRSSTGAGWLSVLHPGLGEYFLKGFGSWSENMPPKKFWLGWIPLFGTPGYLQVKSARDAFNCKTTDGIGWNE